MSCLVLISHTDGVIKWKHSLRHCPFVRGIHRSPVDYPHRVQCLGTLMFSLIGAWTNGRATNQYAGDLRRHYAHYDVAVMHYGLTCHFREYVATSWLTSCRPAILGPVLLLRHDVVARILAGFYTKGRPLVKSNLICPSDKLSWQPGCPVLNINIQGNFCISQVNGPSDNLPELV